MNFIHLECDVEVIGSIDDNGGAVLICPACGRTWTAELVLQEPKSLMRAMSDPPGRAAALRVKRPDWFSPHSD